MIILIIILFVFLLISLLLNIFYHSLCKEQKVILFKKERETLCNIKLEYDKEVENLEKYKLQLKEQKEKLKQQLEEDKIETIKQNTLSIFQEVEKRKEEFSNYCLNITSEEEKIKQEVQNLKDVLNDYKIKRNIVNQEIIRAKEILEQENFYKVILTDKDINDLQLIKEIEYRFNNKEILQKSIYECYIKKPANEMIKRVLKGASPSGIYKITYLPTKEAYIGRAVSVDKRWLEHIKSAFSLGTIAHSSLHTKMEKEGIWNFSFELLEEIEKEKLSEREKYWIDFYETKKYGFNMKEGG